MHRFILIIALLPLIAFADDRYTVQFDPKLTSVTVEACFDGPAPTQLHRNSKSERYTNWVRANGLNFDPRSRGSRITLPDMADNSCVGWQVQLDSALTENDYRLALRVGSDILTSGDLWFWRDGEKRPITVDVRLPENLSISTPWKDVHGSPGLRLFQPDPTPVSWSSRIAIGRFKVQQIPVGETVLRLATLGDMNEQQQEKFALWVRENALSVASVYGQFPREAPQILVVPIESRNKPVLWAHVIRGGGVAAEFFVDEKSSLEHLREDWTATHELSHMLLPYVSRADRWLSEGLASYYQNVLRARDGRLSEKQAWSRLHTGFERGRSDNYQGSLAAAARSGRNSTMRVYWSGAAIMLQADTLLRSISNGRQSLDTALAGLRACCLNSDRAWRGRDLFAELDRISGTSVFSDLYRDQVMDEEFPNLSRTFERLGLVLDDESLELDPDAPWGRIRFYIMKG